MDLSTTTVITVNATISFEKKSTSSVIRAGSNIWKKTLLSRRIGKTVEAKEAVQFENLKSRKACATNKYATGKYFEDTLYNNIARLD